MTLEGALQCRARFPRLVQRREEGLEVIRPEVDRLLFLHHLFGRRDRSGKDELGQAHTGVAGRPVEQLAGLLVAANVEAAVLGSGLAHRKPRVCEYQAIVRHTRVQDKRASNPGPMHRPERAIELLNGQS
jgi:hypothetical protein